ncbi:MAG: cellulase family glycosylhydrolase [Candidatus Kerfeldbacteria bacterium]|nr:cellulase family glycosylhydrolase [Candidatus Kerfeldbacteria bacterium]
MNTETHHHKLRYLLIPVVIIVIGGAVFFWNQHQTDATAGLQTEFGVTLSTQYATYLGLDWKELYIAALDQLGIRKFRIPVYWNDIEQSPGDVHLSDIQWILDEANKRDAKIILAVGMRVPRWPECHAPQWTTNFSQDQMHAAETTMIETVVNQLKDAPALQRWQVENEPFFTAFGECPKPDNDFISAIIQRVKTLDPTHPVVVTDSGELGLWIRTSRDADVLGISMYRTTWNPWFGYFRYPVPPAMYRLKAKFIQPLVQNVIVTELQAEPWVPESVLSASLQDQYKTMDIDDFEKNIDYARRTGFSEVYLWGVEWWYWMKQQQHDDRFWESSKKVFSPV